MHTAAGDNRKYTFPKLIVLVTTAAAANSWQQHTQRKSCRYNSYEGLHPRNRLLAVYATDGSGTD